MVTDIENLKRQGRKPHFCAVLVAPSSGANAKMESIDCVDPGRKVQLKSPSFQKPKIGAAKIQNQRPGHSDLQ
jgi:hypothetical protein